MSGYLAFGLVAVALFVAFLARYRTERYRRAEFIRSYRLPLGLYDKVRQHRPELSYKDCALISHALRQFFLAYLNSGRKFVSMPSQVADELWHEFILYTREYQRFCRKAFGGFLHHTPAVVLSKAQQANEGLRRTWWYACKEENVNPRRPLRLPLLFALDSKLKIANGFHYAPNCEPRRRAISTDPAVSSSSSPYCGGDFASNSYDGSTMGFGDSADGFFGEGGVFEGGGASTDFGVGCSGSGCGGGGCGGGGGD